MKIILNNWGKIIFIISVISITSALVAEYFFNLLPCKMCLHQRYSYYFIIFIFILFYFFKKTSTILIYILAEFAIIYGLYFTIWHVGIENNLLKNSSSCAGVISKENSLESLKNKILEQDIVNCSEVSWVIFGLSAATINLILLTLILIINTIYIYQKYYEK